MRDRKGTARMNRETIFKQVVKPGRYVGGEYGQILKDKNKVKSRFAFCFPDTYEIGMSNLGIRILYGIMNEDPDIWCERCYTPWQDMQQAMRTHGIPLYALESGDPLCNFDFVGFTLQYELCYTNVLLMLELANIPLLAAERTEDDPIIIGGGPCTYNAEPIADFFDLFSIGEGEDALVEINHLYISMKQAGTYTRTRFLREAAKLEGFYVPSLYRVEYHPDGTVKAYLPLSDDVPCRVKKRIMPDMDKAYFPKQVVMPYIETVHDRMMLEVFRGCIRGCRFCQAGMTYRPVREKSPEVLDAQAKCLYAHTGYDEMSLSSLSISDYSRLPELTDRLLQWTDDEHVSLSLPSLRADSFTKELMDKVSSVRTSGLTFAPEAGTQRLRDAINKNVTAEEILRACDVAFDAGKTSVKLYFMQGLPTETEEDLLGIGALAEQVVERFYQNPNHPKGKAPTVTVSVSCFIPKPFTPFQWDGQNAMELLQEKQKIVGSGIHSKKVRYTWHDAKVSRLEAVFARGDRRLSAALLEAHRVGLMFDSWDEYFDYDKWMQVFSKTGIDVDFYATRTFSEDEVLPWDVIDCGVKKEFLQRERHKAYESKPTPNCKEQCSGCGANSLGGNCRWCPKQSE